MPTYEYACRSCGEHLEIVQSFKDDPITECPACGGPLRKVFGSVGIVFKGKGFYKTDSRSSSKVGAGAPAGSSAGESSSAAAGGSGDSSSSSSGETSPSSKPSADAKSSDTKSSDTKSSPGKSSSDSKPKTPRAASA